MAQQTMTIEQWAKTAHDVLAVTQPMRTGKLDPRSLTPDLVYKALCQIWDKLNEAGNVFQAFANTNQALALKLGEAQKLIAQQHNIIRENGCEPVRGLQALRGDDADARAVLPLPAGSGGEQLAKTRDSV